MTTHRIIQPGRIHTRTLSFREAFGRFGPGGMLSVTEGVRPPQEARVQDVLAIPGFCASQGSGHAFMKKDFVDVRSGWVLPQAYIPGEALCMPPDGLRVVLMVTPDTIETKGNVTVVHPASVCSLLISVFGTQVVAQDANGEAWGFGRFRILRQPQDRIWQLACTILERRLVLSATDPQIGFPTLVKPSATGDENSFIEFPSV